MHLPKDREHYQREKDKYYREKQTTYSQAAYKDNNYIDVQYSSERVFRERKEDGGRATRHLDSRKYDEKKTKESREVRYTSRDSDKHRRERYEEEKRADKTLQDLRERLLSKRTFKSDDESYKLEKTSSHRDRRYKEAETIDSALLGAAGEYVKEIINISAGEERRSKKDEKNRDDEKLTEEERAEQELRREKLLEAGMYNAP